MKRLIVLMLLILMSCGSGETIKTDNLPDWNIDDKLANDFWGAVNMLEEHGTNLSKLQSEDIKLSFVDDLKRINPRAVAEAQLIYVDGIRIVVSKELWVEAKTADQQSINILTMLHELGHDYLNLKGHYEDEWDIMNSTSNPNIKISEEAIVNSINRMLIEGRKVYDSLALTERF